MTESDVERLVWRTACEYAACYEMSLRMERGRRVLLPGFRELARKFAAAAAPDQVLPKTFVDRTALQWYGIAVTVRTEGYVSSATADEINKLTEKKDDYDE